MSVGRLAGAIFLGGAGVPLALELGRSGMAAADNALDPEPQEAGYGYERRSPLETALLAAGALAGGTAGAALASPQGIARLGGNRVVRGIMEGPIARSAQRTADRPLSWIERQGLSSEQLRDVGLSRIETSGSGNAPLTEKQSAVLEALGVDREAFDKVAAGEVGPTGALRGVVGNRNKEGRLSNEAVYALARLADNRGLYSGLPNPGIPGFVAQHARHAGVPLAANAAVAGGTVLALKGAYDVIARIQAGQPVSEEEAVAAGEVLKSVSKESEEVVP